MKPRRQAGNHPPGPSWQPWRVTPSSRPLLHETNSRQTGEALPTGTCYQARMDFGMVFRALWTLMSAPGPGPSCPLCPCCPPQAWLAQQPAAWGKHRSPPFASPTRKGLRRMARQGGGQGRWPPCSGGSDKGPCQGSSRCSRRQDSLGEAVRADVSLPPSSGSLSRIPFSAIRAPGRPPPAGCPACSPGGCFTSSRVLLALLWSQDLLVSRLQPPPPPPCCSAEPLISSHGQTLQKENKSQGCFHSPQQSPTAVLTGNCLLHGQTSDFRRTTYKAQQ